MAFSSTEFLPMSAMANSNAPRHFTYTTADDKATVVGSGYFDDAVAFGLQVQDVVECINDNTGTFTYEHVVVDAITSGVVTTLSSTLALT